MKKIILFLCAAVILLSSCDKLKEEKTIFEGNYVEIDATVLNAPAAGKSFPVLVRLPQANRPVINAQDPLITRASGTIKLRVNLVAAQRATAETLTFQVVAGESTAVDGTHYTTTGTLQIPPNSSFGEMEVNILNPGATTTGAKVLVLELLSNDNLTANPNYNRVGISIAQN